ncbi:MAG: ABC transporter permease [Pigmentiphaga sp.]
MGEAIFTLWLVASVLFVLVHLAPGDPAAALGGETQSAQTRAADLARFGLNATLTERYLGWITALAQGDLGQSFMFRAPVSAIIAERLPVTLALTLPALALSSLLGILLALWTSLRPGTAFDRITQGVILLVFALPVYWVGHLLIQWFALDLRWFPVQGLADLRNPASGWPRSSSQRWRPRGSVPRGRWRGMARRFPRLAPSSGWAPTISDARLPVFPSTACEHR